MHGNVPETGISEACLFARPHHSTKKQGEGPTPPNSICPGPGGLHFTKYEWNETCSLALPGLLAYQVWQAGHLQGSDLHTPAAHDWTNTTSVPLCITHFKCRGGIRYQMDTSDRVVTHLLLTHCDLRLARNQAYICAIMLRHADVHPNTSQTLRTGTSRVYIRQRSFALYKSDQSNCSPPLQCS